MSQSVVGMHTDLCLSVSLSPYVRMNVEGTVWKTDKLLAVWCSVVAEMLFIYTR